MHNKKSRPVLQHHGGKEKTFAIILPLLFGAVKAAAVLSGVVAFTAAGCLNVPALFGSILVLNALIGVYYKLEA